MGEFVQEMLCTARGVSWRLEREHWPWCGVVCLGRDVNGAANDFFDSANRGPLMICYSFRLRVY